MSIYPYSTMFLAASWLQQGAQRSGVQIQGGLALAENRDAS